MKKIISIILLAVIVSTSVLFTGCGGEVASNNAQTSDEADNNCFIRHYPDSRSKPIFN